VNWFTIFGSALTEGALTNENAGGFASLSYPVLPPVSDFTLSFYVYCPVTPAERAPLLAGIAFLIDPVQGEFYRLICDFKTADPFLNLAYVGRTTMNYPVSLMFWWPKEIPGGVPQKSGWHKMAFRVKDGKAALFWDDKPLPGGPFDTSKIERGYVGVYTNFVGGLGRAAAVVDAFELKPEEKE
jgi:hypothetical protein